jgi:thymidylate kinase
MKHGGGFTVALIGPDGAGKTTVARHLEQALQRPAVYLYMGDNPDASNRSLPTTRLAAALKRRMGRTVDNGPPDWNSERTQRRHGRWIRGLRSAKSLLRVTNQLAEEYYRLLVAWRHLRGGRIVLFDRHFYTDYYAWDVVGGRGERTLARRIHGAVLSRTYPKPDLVLYLDAPPEVLFERKGEGTLQSLRQRREDYLSLGGHLSNFVVIDAGRELGQVVEAAREVIEAHAVTRSNRA